jgi:hypothetical protein
MKCSICGEEINNGAFVVIGKDKVACMECKGVDIGVGGSAGKDSMMKREKSVSKDKELLK